MGVSRNSGTPKSSILVGFSIINHPFWGTPIFGNPHMLETCGDFTCFMSLSVALSPDPNSLELPSMLG